MCRCCGLVAREQVNDGSINESRAVTASDADGALLLPMGIAGLRGVALDRLGNEKLSHHLELSE